jgi:murein L,D-transpeptidase YafK
MSVLKPRGNIKSLRRMIGACMITSALAAPAWAAGKAEAPVPTATLALMAQKNMAPGAPVLVRSYKKEAVLEVWKQTRDGRYALLKSFPICRWSGQLGPKRRQGDRQAPEGFYSVTPRQMNPNSAYYLSFDTGYPNAYDRAHGASGSALMVHGICSSAGCYAMTNQQIGEIYALARDALASGQSAFQMQAYPFRMSAQNMANYRADPNIAFWRQLKEGYDHFEATGQEPRVTVAGAGA